MGKYSKEFKQSLIKKVLLSPDKSVSSIASEANLNGPTLHRWLKESKNDTISSGVKEAKRPCDWTREQRFAVLVESENLSDDELGAFCRKKGIYSHQVKTWKTEFMAHTNNTLTEKQKSELKVLRATNKELERDLRRKEKALAEATALLVLKKKADLIWGASKEG